MCDVVTAHALVIEVNELRAVREKIRYHGDGEIKLQTMDMARDFVHNFSASKTEVLAWIDQLIAERTSRLTILGVQV